ncbi:hypothetical protein TNCV_911801 [Trichonephila clavipes]|nr:hypothetical protein TNCV_911801 [Trichonephila clavipes]
MSNVDDNRRNWRNSEVMRRPSNGKNDYRDNYENGRQENPWFSGMDFKRMIEDLTIGDTSLEMEIDEVVKTIEEGKVEIDLSKTRLGGKQKQELRDLFNSFQGLFSDKPGITHVLYHEIDKGDKPPVVSRPYR